MALLFSVMVVVFVSGNYILGVLGLLWMVVTHYKHVRSGTFGRVEEIEKIWKPLKFIKNEISSRSDIQKVYIGETSFFDKKSEEDAFLQKVIRDIGGSTQRFGLVSAMMRLVTVPYVVLVYENNGYVIHRSGTGYSKNIREIESLAKDKGIIVIAA